MIELFLSHMLCQIHKAMNMGDTIISIYMLIAFTLSDETIVIFWYHEKRLSLNMAPPEYQGPNWPGPPAPGLRE